MTIRQLRLFRGAVASSVATIFAAVSHTVGGGTAPHPLLILTVAVLLSPLAALLVGTRIRLSGLTGAVLSTQFVFHALFELTGGIAPTGLVGGHQHGPIVLELAPGTHPDLLSSSPGMLLAHLLAALLTTLLLWRGELLIRAIARWVRTLLRLPQTAPAHPVAAPANVTRTEAPLLDRLLADCAWRRGPPASALS